MKILFALFSYLFGSIPSGYILFRLSDHKDIRHFGSQTTGATNILRLKGWKYGLAVLLIDFAKGFIPVSLALRLFSDKRIALISAALVVVGHCFPLYIKFRGGKGLATTMGTYAALAFKPFLLSFSIFLFAVVITRYVSLGSIAAVFSFPLLLLLFDREKEVIFLSLVLLGLVLIRHVENIKRLIHGKERRIGEKVRI